MNKVATIIAWSLPIAGALAIALLLRAHYNDIKQQAIVEAAVTQQNLGQGILYAAPKLQLRYSVPRSINTDLAEARLTAYYSRAGGAPIYCLDWRIRYFRETGAYFDRAALYDGTPLHVNELTSHVVLCTPSDVCESKEEITVTLPQGSVNAAKKSGLRLYLRARDNIKRTVHIPAPYIKGFMNVLPLGPARVSSTTAENGKICSSSW